MSSYSSVWSLLPDFIRIAEDKGAVTATFRRLDEVKQKQIIIAVIEALSETPGGVNIKIIAQNASVSIGSMYQYFRSSESMTDFCVRFCAYGIEQSFHSYAAYFDTLSFGDAIRIYLIEGIKWSSEEASLLRLFARSAYYGEIRFRESLVRPISAAVMGLLKRIFENAENRGELRAGIDRDEALRLTNGFLTSFADTVLIPHLNIYFGYFSTEIPTDIETHINHVVDFVLRSIGAEKLETGGPS